METLKDQVEKIIDESDKKQLDVIIQMKTSDDSFYDYVTSSSNIIGQRRSTVKARLLAPPPKDVLPEKKDFDYSKLKRSLSRTKLISAKNLAATYSLGTASKTLIQNDSRSGFNKLLQSDVVRKSISKKVDKYKSESDVLSSSIKEFWSSNSVMMKMTRDQLYDLQQQGIGIDHIFINRTHKGPKVYKSDKLPPVVRDNKSYTWGLAKTGAMSCWGAFQAKGEGVKIAVLDTGIDPDHPDLSGKVIGFAEFDRKGRTIKNNPAQAYDSDSHGTHCAGSIAGGKNSGRWIGMAPDSKIFAGLVLKNGFGTDAQILAGIDWALASGVDIINMSLGGLQMTAEVLDYYTKPIINANRLGVPVVVAVGNDGSQTSGMPGNDYYAFTAGATDHIDRVAGFSGGRTQIIEESRFIDERYLPIVFSKPEVSAPGVDIYSSIPNGKYATWNGTSMATPHLTGAIALLLSKQGNIRNLTGLQRVEILQALLISTVKEVGESGQDHRYGFGRIDVLKAMGYAEELNYW